MTRVAVKPDLIRWAIARSGVAKEELQKKFPKLDDWLGGENQPTFRQLEDFARTTMTPFGTMFLDEPPEEKLPIPDFRTRNDRPLARFSPNLIDTIHTIQRRQSWLREWLAEKRGNETLPFVGAARVGEEIKALAQRIRQYLNLDPQWAEVLPTWEDALQTLRKAIERSGVIVFSNSVVGLNNSRPLDPDEFRGFVLCDPLAPIIFVNDADTKSARIFTLAHEIAHVWIGQDGLFNLEKLMPAHDAAERFCNQVAAEFLIPAYKLTQSWNEVKATSKPFHHLARKFKVSPVVAARRALDLKLINKVQFFAFYEQDRADWFRKKEEHRQRSSGGNFYATQNARLGRIFSAAIVSAAREGRILYEEAFQLTGLKGNTFNEYSNQVLQRMRDEHE